MIIRSECRNKRGLFRTISRWQTGLLAIIVFLIPFSSRAHDVFPAQLKLYFGEAKTFHVKDPATCNAQITATVADTSVASITNTNPATGYGIDVSFEVTASDTKAGSTTIAITVVGEDVGGSGPCQEDTRGDPHQLVVQVIDPETVSSANNPYSGTSLDPINTSTGELTQYEPYDLYLDGPLPLYFQRYYASYLRRSYILGNLGNNWLDNFDWNLHWVGNLIVITTDRGKVLKYTSDGQGNWTLQSSTDPTPYQIKQDQQEILLYDPNRDRIYRFNAEGKLSEILDGKGNKLTLTYGDTNYFGLLVKVADGLGRELRFDYTQIDNLWKLYDVLEFEDGTFHRSVSFWYDAYNADDSFHYNLTSYTNPNYADTTYAYSTDTAGTADWALLTSRTLPGGVTPYTQTFYTTADQFNSGKVKTQTDASGNVTTLTYDNNNGTTTVTDAASNSLTHAHDGNQSLTAYTNKAGKNISLGYNANNQRNSITDPLGGNTSYGFDASSGKLASENNEDADQTQFQYSTRTDSYGFTHRDLTGITYADGTSESFVYDTAGNLLTRTDRAGNAWTYTYNNRGQRLTSTNPENGVTTFAYNADGTLHTRTDNAGNVTTYQYDSYKRVSSVQHADNTSISYTYNELDNITAITDEVGHVTQMSYNPDGTLSQVTNTADNATTSIYYDSNNRIYAISDPLGNLESRGYDALGRLHTLTDAKLNTTTFNYDSSYHLTSTQDAGGATWLSSYDDNGKLASGTMPSLPATTYTRDPAGSVTAITSPLGNTTHYTYDSNGRATGVTDPMGNTTGFTFDALGNVTGIKLPANGPATSMAYNKLGKLTAITDPAGHIWHYSYDPQGRVTTFTDPLGNQTNYAYDSRNRISMVTYPGGGTQSITYNGTGNTTQRSFSDGTTISYTYDSSSRMTAADGISFSLDLNGHITDSNGIVITYDELGRPLTVTFATGKTITYSYNVNGRLASVSDWAGGTSTFSYDDAGRLTGVARPNGVTTTTTYDDDSRISGIQEHTASSTLSSLTFSRNANGQVISETRNLPLDPVPTAGSPTMTYDAASQVNGYSYDAMGRLLDDGSRTYTWDLATRLTSFSNGTKTINYTYNAFGDLLTRSDGSKTYQPVWNYALSRLPVISILRIDSADVRYYVHTPEGLLLYSIEAGDNSRHFYHFDSAGNTLYLTDDNGVITDSYAYTPYGTIIDSTGNFENLFTYGGEFGVIEEEDGLYLMHQRIYDSRSKRFISRDPIKARLHPLTVNPYAYAAGNPLNYVDPMGAGPTAEQLATTKKVGEKTLEYGSAATGAVGIADNYIGGAAQKASDLAEALSNALPANATPRDINIVTGSVKEASRLEGIAKTTNAIGNVGTALQFVGVGIEGIKLKNALDRVSDAYGKRVALAFYTAKVQSDAAWEIFNSKKIPNDLFYEVNRDRWELKLRHRLHVIQENLNWELMHAGFDEGTDTWLSAMVAAKEMLGTFVPVPRSWWPDFLSPENNYPGTH